MKAKVLFTAIVCLILIQFGNVFSQEDRSYPKVIREISPITDQELTRLTGLKRQCVSSWRMVVRGSPVEHYRFQLKWTDVSYFAYNSFTVTRSFVGPYSEWPFYYSGEACAHEVMGFMNLNYAPWCVGAEFIIESKSNIDAVLFVSDPDFPLYFKFTKDGFTYLSGSGKVVFHSGKVIELGRTIAIQQWRDMLSSPDAIDREAATYALGWLKDKDSVLNLIKTLQDAEPSVRRNAAESLGKIGDIKAADALGIATGDDEDDVARVAAEALGKFRSEKGTDALIDLLDTAPDARIADVAENALKEMAHFQDALSNNDPIVPIPLTADSKNRLIKMLTQKDVKAKCKSALSIVGLTADSDFVPVVKQLVQDKESPDRAIGVVSLAFLSTNDAMDVLPKILADEKEEIWLRRNAAWMLGRVGGQRAFQILASYLKAGTEDKLLTGVALGLGQSKQPKAVELIKDFLVATTDEDQRIMLTEALSKMSGLAMTPLSDLVGDSNYSVRYYAIVGLGRSKDHRAIPPLVRALSDDNLYNREEAAKALEELDWVPANLSEKLLFSVAKSNFEGLSTQDISDIGPKKSPESVQLFVKALRNSDLEVREEAARMLANLGWKPTSTEEKADFLAARKDWSALVNMGKESLQTLLRLFDDDANLQPWASEWLSQIGIFAIPELVKRLGAKYNVDSRWAAEALVRIGEPSKKSVLDALNSESSKMRLWAARTIGNLGDPTAAETLRRFIANESDEDARFAGECALKKLEQ